MVRVRLETSREHVAEPARLRDPLGAEEDCEEYFRRLLERTTLSAPIKASTAVADRVDFLTALEHLVSAPGTKATRQGTGRTPPHPGGQLLGLRRGVRTARQ